MSIITSEYIVVVMTLTHTSQLRLCSLLLIRFMIAIAFVLVFYWIVRVTLVTVLGFFPKISSVGGKLCNIALLTNECSLSGSDNLMR